MLYEGTAPREKWQDAHTPADGAKIADDREIDSWAQDGVYRAKAAGIVQGKGNNNFDPNGLLTRQEIAVILQKFHLGFIRAN